MVRQADATQVVLREFQRFSAFHACAEDRTDGQVLQHGHVRKEIELLEHQAHMPIHREPRGARDLVRIHFDAADGEMSLLERLEQVDRAYERRLARA